jgi:uncharacterized protein
MQRRKLGRTGPEISVVGFGGMRFFNADEATSEATVARCLERGINFFETGGYGGGESELRLGKALAAHARREDIVVANKASVSSLPDAGAVRKSMEASLKREGMDYFDLFSFWGCNTRETFDHVMKGGLLDTVLKAKDEGLVRAIGLTTHAQPELMLEFADAYPWDAITLKEHMLFARHQEAVAILQSKGIGVIVMSPLAGGVVAQPGEELRQTIQAGGLTPAVLGLRFLFANPAITTAICGFESPDEVDENVVAGENDSPLSGVEERLVAMIQERASHLEKPFCTSCGYCMPCPQEVNIPGIFRLWNLMRGYGNAAYSKLEYGKMCSVTPWADFVGRSAEVCVECGQCEEKCPEKLPIMADLKRAHADMRGE